MGRQRSLALNGNASIAQPHRNLSISPTLLGLIVELALVLFRYRWRSYPNVLV